MYQVWFIHIFHKKVKTPLEVLYLWPNKNSEIKGIIFTTKQYLKFLKNKKEKYVPSKSRENKLNNIDIDRVLLSLTHLNFTPILVSLSPPPLPLALLFVQIIYRCILNNMFCLHTEHKKQINNSFIFLKKISLFYVRDLFLVGIFIQRILPQIYRLFTSLINVLANYSTVSGTTVQYIIIEVQNWNRR